VKGHLHDDRLFDCYLSIREGERLDPPVAEHLTDCDECGRRYAELTQFLEVLREEAAAEVDEVFTADRLRLQRQTIVRRLEHLGHPARVIRFPGRPASGRPVGPAPRVARRWVAAAAAAGLFIGVGTGMLLDWERVPGRSARVAVARQTVLSAPASRLERVEVGRSDPFDDTRFLSELELAGDRPRIRELSAIDALTPHVREVTLR